MSTEKACHWPHPVTGQTMRSSSCTHAPAPALDALRQAVWDAANMSEQMTAEQIRVALRAALAAPAPALDAPDGASRIAAERRRQIEVEGYGAQHDSGHDDELAMAGAAYALLPSKLALGVWPWGEAWFKPTPDDRVRELVKAGALIAAAIDAALAAKEADRG